MQKIKKYLRKKWAPLTLVFAISMCNLNLMAQSIQINAGSVISKYQYVSTDEVSTDYFKSGIGNYYSIISEFKLLDTTDFLTSTSSKAFYYSKHRAWATFLSRTNFVLGLESLGLNAGGDVEDQTFSYQTSYLGLVSGLNYQQPLFNGWYLKAGFKSSAYKILSGSAELPNKYVDLTQDQDFNKIKLSIGWDLSFGKMLSKNLESFISFSKVNTLVPKSSGASSLNFTNTMFSIGMKFIVTKSHTF